MDDFLWGKSKMESLHLKEREGFIKCVVANIGTRRWGKPETPPTVPELK